MSENPTQRQKEVIRIARDVSEFLRNADCPKNMVAPVCVLVIAADIASICNNRDEAKEGIAILDEMLRSDVEMCFLVKDGATKKAED